MRWQLQSAGARPQANSRGTQALADNENRAAPRGGPIHFCLLDNYFTCLKTRVI